MITRRFFHGARKDKVPRICTIKACKQTNSQILWRAPTQTTCKRLTNFIQIKRPNFSRHVCWRIKNYKKLASSATSSQRPDPNVTNSCKLMNQIPTPLSKPNKFQWLKTLRICQIKTPTLVKLRQWKTTMSSLRICNIFHSCIGKQCICNKQTLKALNNTKSIFKRNKHHQSNKASQRRGQIGSWHRQHPHLKERTLKCQLYNHHSKRRLLWRIGQWGLLPAHLSRSETSSFLSSPKKRCTFRRRRSQNLPRPV